MQPCRICRTSDQIDGRVAEEAATPPPAQWRWVRLHGKGGYGGSWIAIGVSAAASRRRPPAGGVDNRVVAAMLGLLPLLDDESDVERALWTRHELS